MAGYVYIAEIAQLVEQRIRNAWVEGSSPFFGCQKKAKNLFGFIAFLLYMEQHFHRVKIHMNGMCDIDGCKMVYAFENNQSS